MLFYTANRLRETLKMQWAWIDFEKKYLVLPASVTKNKRPHLVPLVQPAIELLEMVKGLAPNSPYVFPGPNGQPLNWIQKASSKVLEAAGIEHGRHHDTRRVVQTNMAELGVAPHVADMVLNHAVKEAPKSRAHYDMYHYIPEKRDALTRWVLRLTEILGYDPIETRDSEAWVAEVERRAQAAVAGVPGLTWEETRARVEEQISRSRK